MLPQSPGNDAVQAGTVQRMDAVEAQAPEARKAPDRHFITAFNTAAASAARSACRTDAPGNGVRQPSQTRVRRWAVQRLAPEAIRLGNDSP